MKPTDLLRLGELGQATQLFYPQARPSSAAARYIKSGEAQGVHTAYKCRVRSPWWQVPILEPPDLFLTYMNADTPRFALNSARAHHVNSVHGVYLPARLRSLALPLAVASVNSATMLGAETVGRAYGGGILKLEPGESVHLPLPSIELVSSYARQLRELVAPMNKLLKEGKLLLAAELVDDLLLRAGGGLGDDEVREIREALAGLALRRVTRRAPAPRIDRKIGQEVMAKAVGQALATGPACAPFREHLNEIRQQDPPPTHWDAVSDRFLRSMEAFDASVIAGNATEGERQNGKGDYFNDLLAYVLEQSLRHRSFQAQWGRRTDLP